jgi:hypothetical protein
VTATIGAAVTAGTTVRAAVTAGTTVRAAVTAGTTVRATVTERRHVLVVHAIPFACRMERPRRFAGRLPR